MTQGAQEIADITKRCLLHPASYEGLARREHAASLAVAYTFEIRDFFDRRVALTVNWAITRDH
jgi:hypothetical protein